MSRVQFQEQESFRPNSDGYKLLPFRFIRWLEDEVLLINEVGEHVFLNPAQFSDLVSHRLRRTHPAYVSLKTKHFLLDSGSTVPLELLAAKYRTKKSFLDGFTSLHMFVVTLRCDHSCPYCQVSRVSTDKKRFDMSMETARRSVDLMFCSPAPAIKVEFQGGETLINFELVRFIVDHTKKKNEEAQKDIEFVVATNLSYLDDEILTYMREQSILISTSLDGPAFIHNANRPRLGNNSYELTVQNIRRAKEVLGEDRIDALMTTTNLSLDHPTEIVDEYVRQGFNSIFLRAISPYGFATRSKASSEYSVSRFLSFYKIALDYIIDLNRRGIDFTEVYAQILLRKILTPFATSYVDLQSPAGAGISAVAYNYDGEVYASDEARMLVEMGDKTFRLGNVHEDSYEQIFGGDVVRTLVESSCVEALPGCCDCAFQSFCGADPIFNHTTQGDIVGHRPTSAFCTKNMEIIKHLFGLIRSEDDFVKRLFMSWATSVYLQRPSMESTDETVYAGKSVG